MKGITPCLVFNDRAEEAVKLYVSVIPNSRIINMTYAENDGPIPRGKVQNATFELDGRELMAFDGGQSFSFSEGMSLMVTCDTQEEIDEISARLIEGGGEQGPCGWLTDRFGLSWQIVPAALGEMLGDSVSGNSNKVVEAMLGMRKLDVAALRAAYGA
jgi:predicted 3-demethylubiquinone-9 3-methyltransferase (glyoxalase superfamily)